MVKKGFFKRNWDIISAYSVFILGFLIMIIALSGCSGFGCLGLIGVAILGAGIYNIFMFVGIWRTWKDKKLSRRRWLWILIPMGIGTFATLFSLISPNGFGITFLLGLLAPIIPLLLILKIFGFNANLFSVVGTETISNITITEYEEVLKGFPYLNEGVHQLIMRNSTGVA